MEDCPTYNLRREPTKNLLPTPPYCWTPEAVDKSLQETQLEISDPGKILLLSESLFDCKVHELEKKFNHYIQKEAEASLVFLMTLECVSREAVIYVINQDVLPLIFRFSTRHHPIKEILNQKTPKLHYFENFHVDLQELLAPYIKPSDRKTFEILTIPIISKLKKGNDFAIPKLISIVNSSRPKDFLKKLVEETCRFCLPVMLNTTKLEEESRTKKQCQSLLHVARRLFSQLGDLSDLLREIMSEARRLTKAERCSLFLLDPDHIHLVAKVFDGVIQDQVTAEVKIAKDQGIAGHVAATGQLLNIRDAYKHPLFYKGVDEATGFRTRNILCFPIRDETGIIGVAQLCNKSEGDFDFFDEEVALAFSLYCGISIMHSLVYKRLQEAQNRHKLSNELMLYYMKVPEEEVKKVLFCKNRHAYLNFDSFEFSPKRIRISEISCQILRIFNDLNFFKLFGIKRDILTRFVLYVQKAYRNPPYHNWMHAFSVTHFAYAAIKNFNLVGANYFTHLEALAYITACLCHDIDHRGTTNSFHIQTDSVLAGLYSSEGSVMEHHHVQQTMCILNTNDCNFLEGLTNDEYIRFLALVRDMILATDISNHFQLRDDQEALTKDYNFNNPNHKYALMCLLMTCADLSDQIKSWSVIKLVAEQIYSEFFTQGDIEKSLGKKPVQMMDREEADIIDIQIKFLTYLCLPPFTNLDGIFAPKTNFETTIKTTILCWEACKPVFAKYLKKGIKDPLTILKYPEIDEEVEIVTGQAKLEDIEVAED